MAAAGSSDPGEMVFSRESDVGEGSVQVWEQQMAVEEGMRKVMRTLWFSGSPEVWQTAVVFDQDASGSTSPDFKSAPTFHSCKGLALAAALPPCAKRILIIGLGGGALCGWLLENHSDLEQLVACELDQAVAAAAKECFLGPYADDERFEIHVGDGIEYAKQAKEQGKPPFDLVLIDASESAGKGPENAGGAHGVVAPPPALRTSSCYEVLRGVMSEDAVLAVNVLTRDAIHLLDYTKLVNSSFDGGVVFLENRDISHSWMVTPDNKIVLARNGAADLSELSMREKILAYEAKVPAAQDLELKERLRKEFTTLENLSVRAEQLRVYRQNHQSTPGIQ